MVLKQAFPFQSWYYAEPLSQLYFSLTVILLCSPLHKLCFRIFHLLPFTFALVAFYALLMFLLRFHIVQFWCKRVFFALFNNMLFQWYFRTCMRVENGLCSDLKGRNLLWFLFSFSFTSAYLGQFLYEPYVLPVFLSALTFMLMVLYIQLRCSVLFDEWTAAESAPVSWSSTLAQLSQQMGFERPLRNRLLVDEEYSYMLPKLSILYMLRGCRDVFLRCFRPSSVPPTPPMLPLPPEVGGAARATSEAAYSGVVGTVGAAVGGAAVTLAVHQRTLEQNERQHRDTLEQNERQHQATLGIEHRKIAVQEGDLKQRQLEFQMESEQTKIEQLSTHAKSLDKEIQGMKEQIDRSGWKRTEAQRETDQQKLELYEARKSESEELLHALHTGKYAGAEGIAPAVADLNLPAVPSCFEPIVPWPFVSFLF